ncbi:uncharacterized protein PV09_02290, partial [Verruconis gallopava]
MLRLLCVASATLLLVYWITLAIYRLWFHPLAKYPGPFLARITPVYALPIERF